MTSAVGLRQRDGVGLDVWPAPLHLVAPGHAAEVAAPAQDTLTPEESRRLASAHPHSFLHVYTDSQQSDRGGGSDRLRSLIRQGVFRPLPTPMFALYELRRGGHRQRGIVGDVPVACYDAGLVRPHEATHRDKELELARSLHETGMSSSPVCLTYRDRPDAGALVDEIAAGEPSLSFTAQDGVEQTVWLVTQPEITAALRTAFARLDRLYIVDGHHRCAAASVDAARASSSGTLPAAADATFLAVLVSDSQLRLASYHRCVARPAGPVSDLLAALARDFDVEAGRADAGEQPRPTRPHDIGMFLDGRWYRLRLRPGSTPSTLPDSLDAVVLQQRVLGPVLGLADPATDRRLDHLPGTVALDGLVARCAARDELAFVLHPVTPAQLEAVADLGVVMPPKSTCVDPKVGSGVFVRLR